MYNTNVESLCEESTTSLHALDSSHKFISRGGLQMKQCTRCKITKNYQNITTTKAEKMESMQNVSSAQVNEG